MTIAPRIAPNPKKRIKGILCVISCNASMIFSYIPPISRINEPEIPGRNIALMEINPARKQNGFLILP